MEAAAKTSSSVIIEEKGLIGGVNVSMPDTELPQGHLKNAMNLYIDSAGTLTLRKGYLLHSTIPSSNAGVVTNKAIGRFINSAGTNYLFVIIRDTQGSVAAGDQIDFAWYNVGTSTWTVIAKEMGAGGFDLDAKWQTIMMDDLLVCYNGVDRPVCWDGDTVAPVSLIDWYGVDLPILPTAVATPARASPLVAGTYFYILAYYNSQYGFVSAAILAPDVTLGNNWVEIAAGDEIDITINHPAIDPGVDFVRLYRTLIDAPTPPDPAQPPLSAYYFVSDTAIAAFPFVITDNSTDATIAANATFLDEHPSGLLDHSLPPTAMSRACVHKSRLVCISDNAGDESIVFWSRPNWGAYHPPLQNMECDPGAGSNIVNIEGVTNGVIVLKEDRAGLMATYGLHDTWEYRKISGNGCIAPNTVRAVQDRNTGELTVVRLTKSGLYQTDGNADIEIMTQLWALISESSYSDLSSFRAYHEKKDNLYILQGPTFQSPSGIYSAPGTVSGDVLPHGFILSLNHPVHYKDKDGKIIFLGYATTLTTTEFQDLMDITVADDDYIYGSLGDDDVYRIWTGNEDLTGNTIDFQFRGRPIVPSGGFATARYQNIYIAMVSLTASFDLYYEIDRGKCTGQFSGLIQTYATTFLDENVYDRLPAPTWNAWVNGTVTPGDYYYKYYYWDSVTGNHTMFSEESAMITVPADPNDGVILNLPTPTTAATAKYTNTIICIRASGSSLWSLGPNTAIANTTITISGNPTYPWANYTIDELFWSTPLTSYFRLPNRGKLKASAKGEMIEIVCAGSTDDGELRFLRYGVRAKPKMAR